MSTRCRIGIIQDDKTIRSIYCHFDGYPDGVGQTLQEDYNDVEKINKLLDLGDISCLGSEPISKPEFWEPGATIVNQDYTIAYKDRGEDCPAEISKTKEDYYVLAEGCDYVYIFYPENASWRVGQPFYGVGKEKWLSEVI